MEWPEKVPDDEILIFLKECMLSGIEITDESKHKLDAYVVYLYFSNFYLLDKDDRTFSYYSWEDADREYRRCEPKTYMGMGHRIFMDKMRNEGWTGPTS